MITVIVPVYNVQKYLERCVKSLLKQKYKDLEIILVDDGSTDLSGKMCDEYAERYSQIRVIHKENGGLSSARNAGIEQAKGEFLSFIDSDDWVSEEYFSYLYTLMQQNEADISECDFKYIDDGGKLYNSPHDNGECIVYTAKQAIKNLLLGNYIVTSATGKLYRRELFFQLRYPEGEIYEDISVTYEAILRSKKVAFGCRAHYYYYLRSGSISNSAFSPKRMEAMQHLQYAVGKVNETYPDMKRETQVALFRMAFAIWGEIEPSTDNKVYLKEMQRCVKESRMSVICSPKTSFKWKIKAIISFFGSHAVRYVIGRKFDDIKQD